MLFRTLSPEEEKTFRQYARDHYEIFSPINGVWHPAVQDECRKMNEEAGATFSPEALIGAAV